MPDTENKPVNIIYKLEPKTLYIVSKFVEREDGSCEMDVVGTYDSPQFALEVGTALAKEDRERLNWAIGDPRLIMPEAIGLPPVFDKAHGGTPVEAPPPDDLEEYDVNTVSG